MIIDNKPTSWPATTKWEQGLNDFITKFQDGNPRFRDEVRYLVSKRGKGMCANRSSQRWKDVFEKQLPGNPLEVVRNTITDHLPRFSLPLGEGKVPWTVWLSEDALWSRIQTLSHIAVLKGAELENAKKVFDDALKGDDVARNEKDEVAVHGVTYYAWTDCL